MRSVVQRVSSARVTVDQDVVGAIDLGLLALVAVMRDDVQADVLWTARKLVSLRVFPSDNGDYDRDVTQVGGAILLVSNFTVAADVASGRRPGFSPAMPPADAAPVFDKLVIAIRDLGVRVETGRFGAAMRVELANDGPLTLVADSRA